MSINTELRNEIGADHWKKFWAHHDRDTYRCPDCGRKADHPDIWRMEVHHINENPLDGSLRNLVGLCHHCHMQRHGNRARQALDDWKMKIHFLGGDQ